MSTTIKLKVDTETMERVKQLVKRTRSNNIGDLVRKALHLMEVMADADDEGLEVWTIHPSIFQIGRVKQIVVITEETDDGQEQA